MLLQKTRIACHQSHIPSEPLFYQFNAIATTFKKNNIWAQFLSLNCGEQCWFLFKQYCPAAHHHTEAEKYIALSLSPESKLRQSLLRKHSSFDILQLHSFAYRRYQSSNECCIQQYQPCNQLPYIFVMSESFWWGEYLHYPELWSDTNRTNQVR